MKIVLLGARGLEVTTGDHTLSQALSAGHEVTAVIKRCDKIYIQNQNLKVVKGSIMDSQMLASVFAGKEAVISCLLGPSKGFAESMKSIVAAMRTAKITRLITTTSWWTDSTDAGVTVRWLLLPFYRPMFSLSSMRQMEIYLENWCSDLDYTVVRHPLLSKGLITGRGIAVEEDFMVKLPGAPSRMATADLAAFTLTLLNNNQYSRKSIAITYMP